MRSSSQLSSLFVKMQSSSLRMKTNANTCTAKQLTFTIKITNFSLHRTLYNILLSHTYNRSRIYHHGENDGSFGGFSDPEEDKGAELDDGEQVDLPQRNMSQIDEVGLVFRWHPEQLQTVKELRMEQNTHHHDHKLVWCLTVFFFWVCTSTTTLM